MRHPIRDAAGTGDQLGVAPVDENPPAATVWAGSIGPLPVTSPRSVPGPPPRLRVWASSANGRGWLLAASPLITAIFLTLLAASAGALCWPDSPSSRSAVAVTLVKGTANQRKPESANARWTFPGGRLLGVTSRTRSGFRELLRYRPQHSCSAGSPTGGQSAMR